MSAPRLPSQLSGVSDGRANGQHPSARRAERGKFSSSHDFSMGRSASRTTSSSVGSCFFTVSVNVLNAEPIAAVALGDSNPASGFAPVFSPKARGSGVNVVSPASASAANGAHSVFHERFLPLWPPIQGPSRLLFYSRIELIGQSGRLPHPPARRRPDHKSLQAEATTFEPQAA
jgi:hypothetical protein